MFSINSPTVFVLVLALSTVIDGVDKTNFKTCAQSSFCRRCRQMEAGKSTFQFQLDKTEITPSSVQSELVDVRYNVRYSFHLYAVDGGIFRLKINELNPLKPRFEVPYVLVRDPALQKIELVEKTRQHVIIKSGPNAAKIIADPFRVDFYSGEDLVVSANHRGLMKFEFIRPKPEKKTEDENVGTVEGEEASPAPPVEEAEFSLESGAWEENYKSHHDFKPNGPEAVAMDFSFPGAHYVYGLPEHTDPLALKTTKNSEPYRLYNLDVFEYELDNGMALYAGIPLVIAHGLKSTVGVFWLNAAETWVDVVRHGDQNVISSIVNLVSGSNVEAQVDTHFMSESGIMDTFVLLGPQPDDVQRQYASLTGTTPLPQMFATAYHQCRWNYNDQDDVRSVANGFDQYDIPMDVMWLDIEHTDQKKYFTWDPVKFTEPLEMTKNLTAKGRKLVVIVDPHIKRDSGYFVHNDCEANNYYVKNREGKDYEGWCWPGSSSYPDFLNPVVREYFSDRYQLENFKGSTLDTYIWNDMNEPSVFNGPEVTMPKDMVHHGGWEHRDIHNIYGLLYTMITYDGLLRRSEGKLRPFILTRSAFAGSQRNAAIWTGDNMADWGHLKASLPMCLSLSLAGMSMCGADVGGFFQSPDAELFARWYQTAAFQPFYRAHSHIDTKRREPWIMGEPTTSSVRLAIRKRYTYLPFWYTLHYEHEKTANLVMRPLFTEFTKEEKVFTIDDEYLLGRSILVHPVTDSGASQVTVYFPGRNEVWYDADTYQKFTENGNVKIAVDMDKIPVFLRGGHIIPKKERVRRSSPLMRNDPYTLIVALNTQGQASGTLYIDDEESFDYRQGKFLYLEFQFENGKLTARYKDPNGHFETKSWLERVVIVGLPTAVKGAKINVSGEASVKLQTTYSSDSQVLVIRKPGVNMAKEWEILLK